MASATSWGSNKSLQDGDPMEDIGIEAQDALIPPQILQMEEPLSLDAKQTIFKAPAAKATMTELLSSLVRALFMIQQQHWKLEIGIRETIEKTH